MYDTILLKLSQSQAGGVNFAAAANCLNRVVIHDPAGGGFVSYTGYLDNLKIWFDENSLKLIGGSLCKWFLGDNYQSMARGDVQRAFEKLSDILHLPIERATITRADFGRVFVLQQPVEIYYNHLGELSRYNRLEAASGLYYTQGGEQLCLYDKNREQRRNGERPPALYCDKNVLRYEQRYLKHLHKKWGEVTAARLYEENFYICIFNRWRDTYRAIKKINDIQLNFDMVKGKKDLYQMCLRSQIEQAGGVNNVIAQINEAAAAGKLTPKQAYDLRKAINDACTFKSGATVRNEAIEELDKKINEATRFCR